MLKNKKILIGCFCFLFLLPINVSAKDETELLKQLPIELKQSLDTDLETPDTLNTMKQSYYRNEELSKLNAKGKIQKLSQSDKLIEKLKEEVKVKEHIKEDEQIAKEEQTRIVISEGSLEESHYEYEGEQINPSKLESLGKFRITHYCSCSRCCGKWANGITATGTTAEAGRTIAVNPSQIPYGSKVVINGHVYTAEDCGGGIGSNCIDIYVNSHSEALQKGMYYTEVYIQR